jgi:two-component system sensor histidine kinase/response regulator
MVHLPAALPGVDIAAGLTRVAGNAALYVKLLRTVARDAQSETRKIHDALDSGNAAEVRERAHSLKGAAGNLSITAVHEAAKSLEAAARQEDKEGMRRALSSLESAYVDFTATMDSLSED